METKESNTSLLCSEKQKNMNCQNIDEIKIFTNEKKFTGPFLLIYSKDMNPFFFTYLII